jgi:hypothetical protein
MHFDDRRNDLAFGEEARLMQAVVFLHEFDGDDAVEGLLLRLVNDAHAAAAQFTQYLVTGDSGEALQSFAADGRTAALDLRAVGGGGFVHRAPPLDCSDLSRWKRDVKGSSDRSFLYETGREPVLLRDLQPIAATLDWRKQRKMWGNCLN